MPSLVVRRPPSAMPGNRPPAYPQRALRRGIDGTVLLSVEVDAYGQPRTVEVRATSGVALLDRAAREAVTEWRFEPALENGKPVAASLEVPIRFTLARR